MEATVTIENIEYKVDLDQSYWIDDDFYFVNLYGETVIIAKNMYISSLHYEGLESSDNCEVSLTQNYIGNYEKKRF